MTYREKKCEEEECYRRSAKGRLCAGGEVLSYGDDKQPKHALGAFGTVRIEDACGVHTAAPKVYGSALRGGRRRSGEC